MRITKTAVAGMALVVTCVLVLQGALATPTQAWPPDGNGIGWQYSEEGQGYYRTPQGGTESPGGGGIPTVLTIVGERGEYLACEDPDDPEARDCGAIEGVQCYDTDMDTGRPRFPRFVFTREVENGEPGPWVRDPAAGWCYVVEDDDWVPLEEISYTVDYEVFQPLGDPELAFNPTPRGLVNLPTIVSTDYPEGLTGPAEIVSLDPVQVRIPIDIERPGENLTGEILAEGNYTWTFEDGGTADGRGRPYTASVNPMTDNGYYVSETFTATGVKTVELEVTWTGEVTVPPLEPEPIEPVIIEASDEIEVAETNSVLTKR